MVPNSYPALAGRRKVFRVRQRPTLPLRRILKTKRMGYPCRAEGLRNIRCTKKSGERIEMAEQAPLERVTIEPNTLLFDEGQTGDAAYLITRGDVEIRAGVRGDAPRTVAKRGKGAIIGEMALFDNRPRMAAAIALTRVEAIKISRKEFMARLETIDPIMKSIVKMLVSRVRELSDQVAELKRTDWRSSG